MYIEQNALWFGKQVKKYKKDVVWIKETNGIAQSGFETYHGFGFDKGSD